PRRSRTGAARRGCCSRGAGASPGSAAPPEEPAPDHPGAGPAADQSWYSGVSSVIGPAAPPASVVSRYSTSPAPVGTIESLGCATPVQSSGSSTVYCFSPLSPVSRFSQCSVTVRSQAPTPGMAIPQCRLDESG